MSTHNMSTDYQSRLNLQAEQERRAFGEAQKAMQDKPEVEKPLTREEVQSVINSLVESIKNMVMAQESKFITRDSLDVLSGNILRNIESRDYITKRQALQIAKDAVPPSLYGLDTDETRKRGDTLKLISGYPTGSDRAVWEKDLTGSPFDAHGDKVLYKGVFLREYVNAVYTTDDPPVLVTPEILVAAGNDINPADYATQALYEAALTAAGHSLKPTWDWVRIGRNVSL